MNSRFEQLLNEAEAKKKSKAEEEAIETLRQQQSGGKFGGLEKGPVSKKFKPFEPFLPGDVGVKEPETEEEQEEMIKKAMAMEHPVEVGSSSPEVVLPTPGIKTEDIEIYNSYDPLTYTTFLHAINDAYNSKEGLIVWGEPGFGKSAGVLAFAKATAQKKGKRFVNVDKGWSTHPTNAKQDRTLVDGKPAEDTDAVFADMKKNPDGYFVFADVRVVGMEPPDFTGIPVPNPATPYLRNQPPPWLHIITIPGIDGILFLDEINQGNESIQTALMKLCNERTITGLNLGLSHKISILGAGNIGGMASGMEKMIPALADRFKFASLFIQPKEWLDYAIGTAAADPQVVDFIQSDISRNFYRAPLESADKHPGPRSFVKMSRTMAVAKMRYKGYETTGLPETEVGWLNQLEKIATQQCGKEWAREFRQFVEKMRHYNWDEVVKDPKKFTPNIQEGFIFQAYLRKQIVDVTQGIDKEKGHVDVKEDKKKKFTEVAQVLMSLSGDWFNVCLNRIKQINEEQLKQYLAASLNVKNYTDKNVMTSFVGKGGRLEEFINVLLKAKQMETAPEEKKAKFETEVKEEFERCYERFCGFITEENLAKAVYNKKLLTGQKGLTIIEKSIIMRDPFYSLKYAVEIKQARFPEGEPAIMNDPKCKQTYIEHFGDMTNVYQNKFSSLVEDVEALYEGTTPRTVKITATPMVRAISMLMEKVTSKYKLNWANPTVDQLNFIKERLPEFKMFLINSIVTLPTLSQIEKEDLKRCVNNARDVVALHLELIGHMSLS
jgi:hypothetical protein